MLSMKNWYLILKATFGFINSGFIKTIEFTRTFSSVGSERSPHTRKVVGSSPTTSTDFGSFYDLFLHTLVNTLVSASDK